jgi:hypothetical protein
MVIVKTRGEWSRQAKEAFAELEASVPEPRPVKLRDYQPHNPQAFSRFVEAWYALSGGNVDEEMIKLAGLVPVDQAIGGDDGTTAA